MLANRWSRSRSARSAFGSLGKRSLSPVNRLHRPCRRRGVGAGAIRPETPRRVGLHGRRATRRHRTDRSRSKSQAWPVRLHRLRPGEPRAARRATGEDLRTVPIRRSRRARPRGQRQWPAPTSSGRSSVRLGTGRGASGDQYGRSARPAAAACVDRRQARRGSRWLGAAVPSSIVPRKLGGGTVRLKSLYSGAISPNALPGLAPVVRRRRTASAMIVSSDATAAKVSPTSSPPRTARLIASSTAAMRVRRSRPRSAEAATDCSNRLGARKCARATVEASIAMAASVSVASPAQVGSVERCAGIIILRFCQRSFC